MRPFIKVEATKFTEVGYVGRDVDSIIRDLVESAIKQSREQETQKMRARAEDHAEERILDVLLPPRESSVAPIEVSEGESATRQKFRKKLREGELNDKEIEIEVASAPHAHGNFCATRHGRTYHANPGHVPESGRREKENTEAQDSRGDEAYH